MNQKKHLVVIGATSAIAIESTRQMMTNESMNVSLVGRDAQKLERLANDLRVRYPDSDIDVIEIIDFNNPTDIDKTIDEIWQSKPIDIALIAHGWLPEQKNCEQSIEITSSVLSINGISPMLFAEKIAGLMEHKNQGMIAIIGSVAGDRGRKSNYIYGSAKSLVATYVEGMQHRFAQSNIAILLIKPGPTDTPMTQQFQQKNLKFAPVDMVGRDIAKAIQLKKAQIYTPKKWWFIMAIIRRLPRFIFNKANI